MIKKTDEASFISRIEEAAEPLDKLLTGIEMNCEVSRENDFEHTKSLLDNNMKGLIKDSLKPFKR